MPIQVLATSTDGIQIDTNGRDGIVTEIWFKTEPLTPTLVYRLAQLQLTTDSHDQGFADDAEAGCYSWFEICILADANATEPRQKDGRTLTWRSHGNRVGVSDASRHFGVVFDRRGEMLDDLEPGNVIAVRSCVQFAGWENYGISGTLTAKVLEEDLFSPQSWTLASTETPDLPTATDNGVYTLLSTTTCNLIAESNELNSRIWFSTPALDAKVVANIEEVQLFTKSHDQGSVSFPEAGSWSWFDLVILESPEATTPKVMNGRSLVWASHSNALGNIDYQPHKGRVFDHSHELLGSLEVGNVIAVRACAQFEGWQNHASEGHLVIRISKPPKDGFERTELVGDITKQVNLDIKLQEKINEIYEESYLEASETYGWDLPEYKPLMVEVTEQRADKPTGAGERPLRVLSLDGGGVRGVSSLRILEEIMEKVAPGANTKPCDYFDMIGGTSTGGLIAIMLGRLKMSIQDCQKKYDELAKEVFGAGNFITRPFNSVSSVFTGATYSATTLEKCFKRIIKEYLGSDNATMYEPDAKCKVFVTTVRSDNANNNGVVKSRSYINPDDPGRVGDWYIWQAARATSAAPHYFDSVKIDGVSYVDGGLGYNNPSPELIREARQCFGVSRPFNCILSIGTGMIPKVALGDVTVTGAKSFLQGLLAITTSCEKGHQTLEAFAPYLPKSEREKYHRFNFGVWLGEGGVIKFTEPGFFSKRKQLPPVNDWDKIIEMDEWSKMKNYVNETSKWLKEHKQDQVNRCAESLRL